MFSNLKSLFMSIVIIYGMFGVLYSAGYEFTGDIHTVGPQNETVALQDYQNIKYVSAVKGSDKTGDGSSIHPWKSLSHALLEITDASQENKYALLVSSGIYDDATVVMKEFVDLYGGFDAQNWDRNIFSQLSVLDGIHARRVVVGSSNACIDGFTITHGISQTHGGGILCDDTSPIISNNYVINNMVLEPENFNHNRIHQEGHHGGGIACLYNAVPVIRNNVISGNRTGIGTGGGIVFYGWVRMPGVPETEVRNNILVGGVRAVVENNVITNNISGVNDIHRTRSSSGGGIACAFEARPIIRNNVITENQARGRSDAGGIYSEYFADPLIESNWITGNVCDDDGGGFYTMRLGQPIVRNNYFAGNRTVGGGIGAVRLSKEGRATVTGNIVVRNPGGGVMSVDAYLELENNLIMDNPEGYGLMYLNNFSYFVPGIIRENILRGNEKGEIHIQKNQGQDLIIETNNIKNNNFGKKNTDRNITLKSDGFTVPYLTLNTDPVQYVSEILVATDVIGQNILPGRVLRIGDEWGVVKSVKTDRILVWGLLDPEQQGEKTFEVLPTYTVE